MLKRIEFIKFSLMGLMTGFGVSQKTQQSSFPAGAANNGLSVDPTTGKIVLGNNVSGAAGPAQLLNDREIDMENHALKLIDASSPNIYVQFNNSAIRVFDLNASNFCLINPQVIQLLDVNTNTATMAPDSVAIAAATGDSISFTADAISMKTANQGNGVTIQAPSGVLQIKDESNNLVFQLDAHNGSANKGNLSTIGNISTGDPGAGAGAWKLGNTVAAAVALDVTKYVQVSINGTLLKLALVN